MGYAYSQEKIQMSINYEEHGQHHQSSRKYKLTRYNFPLPDFFNEKRTSIGEDTGNKTALGITGGSEATIESNLEAKAKNANSYDLANSF